MRQILKIPLKETIPSIETVLKAQGLPKTAHTEGRFTRLAQKALEIYSERARPIGVIAEISIANFEHVFSGEGQNDPNAPLEMIYKKSENLALFAVTIGQEVCDEITRLFEINDLAIGSMLDCAASEAAEAAAKAAEAFYEEYTSKKNTGESANAIMRFSPGYCGWHISAQKRLFEYLNPAEVGIHLNSSYLMTPLKSVSGVIVEGDKEIFLFDDVFEFCIDCKDHSCQERIKSLMHSD